MSLERFTYDRLIQNGYVFTTQRDIFINTIEELAIKNVSFTAENVIVDQSSWLYRIELKKGGSLNEKSS